MKIDKRPARYLLPIILALFAAVIIGVLLLTSFHAIRGSSTASGDDLRELVDFTKTLLWPIAVLVVVGLFEQPITAFLERLSKITFKRGDIETTIEAQELQQKVSALVGAQVASAPLALFSSGAETAATSRYQQAAPEVVASSTDISEFVTQHALKEFAESKVLWVDDHPENNSYLIKAFRELGITVDLSTSTEDAVQKLDEDPEYNVIISDVNRPPDHSAGLSLLAVLKERSLAIPVIIFTGPGWDVERKALLDAGATYFTGNAQRLFQSVTNTILGRPMRYLAKSSRKSG